MEVASAGWHDDTHPSPTEEGKEPTEEEEEEAESSQSCMEETGCHLHQRPRLLHICATSFVSVACIAYRRLETIHGPIGIGAQKLSSLATGILLPMEHRLLSLVAFADDRIIDAEDVVISAFPSAAQLFEKTDRVAILVGSLPERFDAAMQGAPRALRQLPLVGWALGEVVDLLEGLNSMLVNWTAVDESGGKVWVADGDGGSCQPLDEMRDIGVVEDDDSYKHKLHEATGEEEVNAEGKEESFAGEEAALDSKEGGELVVSAERKESGLEAEVGDKKAGEKKIVGKEDVQILELFDEGWHAKPGRMQ